MSRLAPAWYYRESRLLARLQRRSPKLMPEELLRHSPLPERPVCPACRESLYPYGALVEKYGHLKWVEAWHCPVHGPVLPYDYAPEKSEPEKK